MGIAILDYGLGNLRSVQKAFERVGVAAAITSDPNVAYSATGLVLPGVGAFKDGMERLRATQLDQVVRQFVMTDRPILGICLGMQLLFASSTEDGYHYGLHLFGGKVVRFPTTSGHKVPHMGWNTVMRTGKGTLLSDLPSPSWMYFVHSYYVVPTDSDLICLATDYAGVTFCSGFERGRLLAVQFHPEKSQAAGRSILHKFATLC
jgi:glutamine amidotransferase